jgi:hypothetical protein
VARQGNELRRRGALRRRHRRPAVRRPKEIRTVPTRLRTAGPASVLGASSAATSPAPGRLFREQSMSGAKTPGQDWFCDLDDLCGRRADDVLNQPWSINTRETGRNTRTSSIISRESDRFDGRCHASYCPVQRA